ncbi:MAG: murein biosynthesis integral membrane protein MurJ [Desulfovibrio sp.]|nr:murein biosynthesis integral membrane protein MurJ [Desulfovibrio sp.]
MAFLTRTHGVGFAALALGLGVFLSRILGLVRDKIISYHFGAGAEADIYFAAFVVPDFLNYLMAGGYFSITLVPLLSLSFADKGEAGTQSFLSAAVCWAALCIGLLTGAAWAAAPLLAPLAAPGFSPEETRRLTHFLRIILPAQACFLPGACFTALLYYRRQFIVPALSPLLYNICIIFGGLAFRYALPERGMEGFCWGALAGAFLGGLLFPLLAARAGGLVFKPRLRHPRMKELLFLALPLMLGQSIAALDEQFLRIFGSLAGEGGVSLLNYARRIMMVPVGVVAQAGGLAAYPFLAALAANGDMEKFLRTARSAAGNILILALPLTVWMQTAAWPIMRLIFQQGGFSAAHAAESGLLLCVMLFAVPATAMQQIAGRAFYAQRDTLTPALIGTLVTLAVLPLYFFCAHKAGAAGVAGAGAFGVILYAVLLCRRLRTKLRQTAALRNSSPQEIAFFGSGEVAGKALPALACSLPAGACSLGALLVLNPVCSPDALGAAVLTAASGAAFALAYLLCAKRFAPFLLEPLTALLRAVRRRFSGQGGT